MPDSYQLTEEQSAVLELVKSGKSIFFTGSAGTGKSYLLRAVIDYLQKEHGEARDSYGITASTGIAAVNIGGCTLHAWSGIGIGPQNAMQTAKKIVYQEKCRAALRRWRDCETLVIDEISMIDGKLFDKLEEIGRLIRDNILPFGGIQIVVSGDFAQLPPVPDRDTKTKENIPAAFAFEALSWHRCISHHVVLRKVFRQRDQLFIDILNEMRFGRVNTHAFRILSNMWRTVPIVNGVEPTELYATHYEVDKANAGRLSRLQTETKEYRARDIPGTSDDGKPSRLILKVGAQIMLIKNYGIQLVNGSLGIVVDHRSPEWARSNHIDISDEDPNHENPHRDRHAYRSDLKVIYPLVQFNNGRKMLCAPADFDVLNGSGDMEARRIQIPLILAWALTIHKSQGQTLDLVKVNMKRISENGQAYVALSRATTMAGLQILNFRSSKVKAHPEVVKWYGRLMEGPQGVPIE